MIYSNNQIKNIFSPKVFAPALMFSAVSFGVTLLGVLLGLLLALRTLDALLAWADGILQQKQA